MVNYNLGRMLVLWVCTSITLFFYGCNFQDVSFIPLKQFDSQDTVLLNGKSFINKSSNYIVLNYRDKSSVIKSIDSIAFKKAEDMRSYAHYTIFFYKASKKTNIEHLKLHPRDFDRHTGINDLLFSYSWIGGKFAARTKYKNGVIIEPKTNIRVE